jgi:hypothetical protein
MTIWAHCVWTYAGNNKLTGASLGTPMASDKGGAV